MKILTLKSLKKEIDELKSKIIKEKAKVVLNRYNEYKAIEDLKRLGWKEQNYNFEAFVLLEKEF